MIQRRKEGGARFNGSSWFYRYRELQPDGTTKYGRREGFKIEEEAQKSSEEDEKRYARALSEQKAEKLQRDNVTFVTYLRRWSKETYAPRVRQATGNVCIYAMEKIIIPAVDVDVPLRSVTTEYLDAVLKRAAAYSKSAGNSARSFLSIAFGDAIKDCLLTRNPIEGTKHYPRDKVNIRIYGKEDFERFIMAASESDWYLEIMLGTFAGLRKGEIYGLKYSDVDLENDTIHIQRQTDNKGVERPLKTKNSDRVLHIHPLIAEEISKRRSDADKNQIKLKDAYHDLGYISCQKNWLQHVPAAMNIALNKLCRRNGLPEITVHGLRHQFATILMEQGVSIERISALLGHASVNTTYEYYIDVMAENEQILLFMNDTYK